jgi:hypothetical protein
VVCILAVCGAALAVFSAEVVAVYGLLLFVVLPVTVGFAAGDYARRHGKKKWVAFVLGQVSLVIAAALLLALGFEGVICLIMAWPLASALTSAGTWLGLVIGLDNRDAQVRLSCFAFAALPFGMVIESELLPEPELHSVSSVIEIDAPPEAVWRNVVGFTELPAPEEAIFRLGLAYPIRAELEGSGVGAVRRCVFSTGAFVEPITVWDEPRRLAFTVERNPPPMTELSPYGEIHPPHLDGYFWSERGEFRLEPLPGGRTRLIGTTWYRQKLWPTTYWLTIHLRVLGHIQARSEM